MVSVLLGALLSLACTKVYLESVRNFVLDEELARIQDNGRYSLNLLRRELMLAGFYAGLVSMSDLPSSAVSTDCIGSGHWALDATAPLDFIDNFDASRSDALHTVNDITLTCLGADQIVSGTDIVAVKRTAGNFTLGNGIYTETASVKRGQWYLRNRNHGGDVQWFFHRSGGFPPADTGQDTRVDYWEYYARIFYIRSYSEAVTDGIPTLCSESLGGGGTLGTMITQCQVEGVEDMQIEFGIDSDSDGYANQFIANPGRVDIGNAVVARIYLLMRSVSPVPGLVKERIYTLGEKQVRRQDGYLRHVMSITVQMPNLRLAVG